MPLLNMKEPYRSMLEEMEIGARFTFAGSYLLDAEVGVSGARQSLERFLNKRIPLNKEEKARLLTEKEKLVEGIIERLKKGKGKIKPYMYSSGGSKANYTDREQSKQLESKGAKVEYTVMLLNGVVVIEPIGQENNATYVAPCRNEKEQAILEEAITTLGRTGAVEAGTILKIIHDRQERPEEDTGKVKTHDFSSEHVLKILDYALERPDELIEVSRKNSGCGLRKISKIIGKGIVSKEFEEYGINKEDVIDSGNEVIENGKDRKSVV